MVRKTKKTKQKTLTNKKKAKPKCDMARCRELYYKYHNITPRTIVQCPICLRKEKAMWLTLHHLLPKSFGIHLYYKLTNLILVCSSCHYRLHRVCIR